ncbi:MAG: hypothetical protein JWN76_1662 [Chitinophagaceae bacterium]|nr:hypothetical protein [Chitinophagaceae bacterium]
MRCRFRFICKILLFRNIVVQISEFVITGITLEDWTPVDYATGLAGEVGELCNFIAEIVFILGLKSARRHCAERGDSFMRGFFKTGIYRLGASHAFSLLYYAKLVRGL